MTFKPLPPGEAMTKTISLALKPATFKWIDGEARRLKKSRSAVLRDILNRGAAALREDAKAKEPLHG